MEDRFTLSLSVEDREALKMLAGFDRCSRAAVVRRLIWQEFEQRPAHRQPGSRNSTDRQEVK